jgi:hypothetical protein
MASMPCNIESTKATTNTCLGDEKMKSVPKKPMFTALI